MLILGQAARPPQDMYRMKRLSFLCLLFVGTITAYSQEAARMTPITMAPALAQQDDGPRKLDITHMMVNSREGQAALHAFHDAKAKGLLPQTAQKGNTSYAVGSMETFNVIINFFTQLAWVPKTFELRDESAVARIWVEVNELSNGNITDTEISVLSDGLLHQTPEGSFNPNQGIIANDNQVYGNPPNFDGDDILDVLLYDVTEGNTDCCIVGFFSPTDINPGAPAGQGNQADIIYLDSNEGSSSLLELLVTAAHEYQHLIHANYEPGEMTFVNEGLSEWSESMNGYQSRANVYLNDPTNHNTSLLTFRSNDPVAVTALDYQRAGLFTSYISEQTSVLTAGSITRQTASGADGYEAALSTASTNLATIVSNFHIANYVNDTGLDPRYGHVREQYQGVKAVPTVQYDGRRVAETPATDASVESGAVQYYVWNDVQDFTLSLDARTVPALIDFQRGRLRPHVVLEANGSMEIQEFPASDVPRTFSGTFDQISLIVPHVEPATASPVPIRYSASWTSLAGSGTSVVTTTYDNGQYVGSALFSLSGGGQGATATRFERPSGAFVTLSEVDVAPLYLNQFADTGQPQNAPRNFRLIIWSQSPTGEPDQELFSVDVEDTRGFAPITTLAIDFLTVDLSNQAAQLTNLPETFFIGLAESGTDSNFMVAGPSPYTVADISFVGDLNDGSWQPLWDVQFVGGGNNDFPARNTVFPIRPTFLISPTDPNAVSNEDELGLPTHIALEANYPNPFNPVTTIQYQLPQTASVTLEVFDMLGQRVAKLADGVQNSGTHSVAVDASGWASGVYVYALTVGAERIMRKMILLK